MKRILVFIPIFLFLLAILVVGKNLDKPFVGIHDWNGARYGNIARNYLRYGLFTVKFGQVENGGVVDPSNFKYLTHYPPLLPILISISYLMFGVNEWATRLIPLLATAGSATLLYFIGRTIFNWEIGIMAAFMVLVTPMIRYFGKNPVHEPLALFFALISFLGALFVLEKKKGGWVLVFLGLILTSLTNWSGVFLALGLTIVLWSKVPKNQIIKIWLSVVLIIVIHFIHVYILTGTFTGGGIFEAFLQRSALGGEAVLTKFTLFEFINRLRLWSSTLFTSSLLFASSLGAYLAIKRGTYRQKVFLFGLLIYGMGSPLIFPNATFIHSYFIFGLSPFLGLCATYAVSLVFKSKERTLLLFTILLIIVLIERKEFVNALEKSEIDRLAVTIGKDMKDKIPERDVVLIKPYDFGASRLPHLSFYSDRKIALEVNSSYNWIIEVDEKNGSYKFLPRER